MLVVAQITELVIILMLLLVALIILLTTEVLVQWLDQTTLFSGSRKTVALLVLCKLEGLALPL
jgi:hypothetical protein